MFWGLGEIVCIKPLTLCPAHSKCSVSVNMTIIFFTMAFSYTEGSLRLLCFHLELKSLPFLSWLALPHGLSEFLLWPKVAIVMILLFTLGVQGQRWKSVLVLRSICVTLYNVIRRRGPKRRMLKSWLSVFLTPETHRNRLPSSVHVSALLCRVGNTSGK